MSTPDQSLWDDEWIKLTMERIAKEGTPMQPFMDTTSSSSVWSQPTKKYTTEYANSVKKEKVEESLKSDPQFFDPKELDIDD